MRAWIRHLIQRARNRVFHINALQVAVLLFFLLLVAAFSGTWVYTDSSGFCAKCHPNMVEHWRSSTHRTVACSQCHINPGMKGATAAKLHGLRNVYIALTKGIDLPEREDPLPINSVRCINCHNGILRMNEVGYLDLPDNSLKDSGLTVAHRVHVEKHGIDCVWCHRGTVHRDPEIVGKYTYNMPLHQDCKACHNGQYLEEFDMTLLDCEDSKSCTLCHATMEQEDMVMQEE